MRGNDAQIRWSDLVTELAGRSSKSHVGKLIRVSPKEVARWTNGVAQPHGHHKEALILECEKIGLNWRKYQGLLAIYDMGASYDRNVMNGPQGLSNEVTTNIRRIETRFLDFVLNSPLGVPASNLTINADWIAPLARRGFDIITSKTVRTTAFQSHPYPNLGYLPELNQPFCPGAKIGKVRATNDLPTQVEAKISLANSFGMPGPRPEIWQEDLRRTRSLLGSGQILIASVVGTASDSQSQVHLVNDFVACAKLAHEVGPDLIEANASCPNVYGQEGSIYQDPDLAGRICRRLEKEIPTARILLKVGYLPYPELEALFNATYKHIAGFTAINTLPTQVVTDGQREEPYFSGPNRLVAGISGIAIRDHALEVVKNLRILSESKRSDLVVLGVGGVANAEDVKSFLDAGANGVQICTAAQFNPYIAIEIRAELAQKRSPSSKSVYLEKAGLRVPFRDAETARAFDSTARVAERTDIPFEIALHALKVNWLDSYIEESSIATESGAKTRRSAPSESQIEKWVREEDEKLQK